MPPILAAEDLAQLLGPQADIGLCEVIAPAVSDAVAAVVDAPPDPLPDGWVWPAGVTATGIGVGTDVYKSLVSPGGGFQMDEFTATDAYRITSVILRRYEPLYNPVRAVKGMIG